MDQTKNQRAADVPTGIYQELEEQIMSNIIRHCRDYNQPIASDVWLLRKLAEIGKLNHENIKLIAKYARFSQTAMERMLNAATEEAIQEMEPAMQHAVRRGMLPQAVPPEKSRNIKQVLTATQEQARDTLNLCNTVMLYKARDAYIRLVQDTASRAQEIENKPELLGVLNKKLIAVITGAESRQQAMRKCIQEFNDKGIPAFVDKCGREWTPEAYVSMTMRSTSNTVAAEVQMARADDFGIDLVEVDSHSGARPKCARDQGKIFDRANKSTKYPHWNTSSYGEPDGLLGINCRHHIYPYVEGISIRRHFPTEDMKENDRIYQNTQKQRAFERAVRKQKRECMLYDQIGDEEAFQQAAVKLKAKEAKLKAYVDSNADLHRRKDREQVVGFNRSISAKATAANKFVEKYGKVKYNEDGVVVVTDFWDSRGHTSIPKEYKKNAVIQTMEKKAGKTQINRTFYDEEGKMQYQVHSGSHANPKQHPYGENGEHAHEYDWKDGKIINRITRNLTAKEKKENGDIL